MNIVPEVSVIVPVYNAEQYLKRCLSSILSQSFKDFEVILINDGSTDNSLGICKKFAEKDSRIRLFNRSNHGVSATRQFGIDNVRGRYCIQIDADDWIDTNYLLSLYTTAINTSSDMVCAAFVREYENCSKKSSMYKAEDVISCIKSLLTFRAWGSLWNRLIRTDIFRQNEISFVVNIRMWEDLAFVLKYLLFTNRIAFCYNTYYHYVQYNSSSLCSTIHKYDVVSQTVSAIENIEQFYKERGCYELYKKEFSIAKLFSKQRLLFDSQYRDVRKWLAIYPESNRYFCIFLYYVFCRYIHKTY